MNLISVVLLLMLYLPLAPSYIHGFSHDHHLRYHEELGKGFDYRFEELLLPYERVELQAPPHLLLALLQLIHPLLLLVMLLMLLAS